MEALIPGLTLDQRTAVQLTAAACGAGALAVLLRTVSRRRAARDKIQRARSRRTESLQRAEQEVQRYRQAHPSSGSALISSSSLMKLTDHLHKGSLTPEEVFYFFMEKTLAAHKKLNCCTEILPESFEQLKTLGSNKDGLLYGVPVSIKENLEYKDHDTSCGVVVNLDQPAKRHSVIVEVLKRQGAVPFVKTNLPQALLNYDCSNPIYGQTLNPHNLQKTSGGSSGGEGALIGAGGSLLGIGSDIGGSIRIPASFCGICGFKPTAGRLSSQGLVPIYRGQKSVPSSPGPMARDVDSLVLCMRALLCDHMFSLDPTVPPLPFNDQIYQNSKPLTIGFLENDGFTEASPAMVRSVREVKALLERAGHTLVPFCPPRMSQVIPELLLKGLFADGATSMLRKLASSFLSIPSQIKPSPLLVPPPPCCPPQSTSESILSDLSCSPDREGGPIDPCLAPQVHLYRLPPWLKKTLSFLFKPFAPRFPVVLRALCGISCISDLWEHHAAVEDYVSETIAAWRRTNLDVLLCPVLGPAFNFLYCGKFSSGISYTMIYNLLNFPAGVVPVSRVTAADEENLKHYKGNFQDYLDKLLPQAVRGGQGLPVGVQCVALPWQDELCLRFMKEVEQLVEQNRK